MKFSQIFRTYILWTEGTFFMRRIFLVILMAFFSSQTAFAAPPAPYVAGPNKVQLHGVATLTLPAGDIYVSKDLGKKIMRQMGNYMDDGFMGLVIPKDKTLPWFVSLEYNDSGFVRDNDSKDIHPDKILQQIRESTKEDNEQRKEDGTPQVQIVGWIEPPHYDAGRHHLIWSLEAHDLGVKIDPKTDGVNYETYALGRYGYISLDLVTFKDRVDQDKKVVTTLLSNLTYNPGKRYKDFNAKTDKIAEYGLLALIGGIAAKKIGLIALFMAKSAKAVMVAAAAGGAYIKRRLGRKKDGDIA